MKFKGLPIDAAARNALSVSKRLSGNNSLNAALAPSKIVNAPILSDRIGKDCPPAKLLAGNIGEIMRFVIVGHAHAIQHKTQGCQP